MSKKKFSKSDWNGDLNTTSTGTNASYKACYHSHPSLKFVALDSKSYEIYGGNCSTPIVYDADIYIGFAGSTDNPSKIYPWDAEYKPSIVVNYYIQDMHAPNDAKSFRKMVDWTCNQLLLGKKIHAGCIGGHGRTGTFLAAVVAQMTGMADAIQYVREHYCKKAVESKEQIDFLVSEYGVSEVEPVKKAYTGTGFTYGGNHKSNGYQGSSGAVKNVVAFQNAKRVLSAIKSEKIIW